MRDGARDGQVDWSSIVSNVGAVLYIRLKLLTTTQIHPELFIQYKAFLKAQFVSWKCLKLTLTCLSLSWVIYNMQWGARNGETWVRAAELNSAPWNVPWNEDIYCIRDFCFSFMLGCLAQDSFYGLWMHQTANRLLTFFVDCQFVKALFCFLSQVCFG